MASRSVFSLHNISTGACPIAWGDSPISFASRAPPLCVLQFCAVWAAATESEESIGVISYPDGATQPRRLAESASQSGEHGEFPKGCAEGTDRRIVRFPGPSEIKISPLFGPR